MVVRRFFAAVIFSVGALKANAETLVVAIPQSDFPALAAQMLDGAKAALSGNWTIKIVDAACTDKDAAIIADLIQTETPDAVIGLPCIETLSPALAAIGPLGIPIVTIASRADGPSKLAAKNKWPLYRTGPRERAESEAIAGLIVDAWRDQPFAILDDGTIFARDTAEAIRNVAETAGVKPVLVDGFQPQLESQSKLIGRLIASGATHVFIAGDRGNIAQIVNEAAALDFIFAGPDTLLARELDFPLPAGVIMAARDFELAGDATAKIATGRSTPFAMAEGYAADAYIATEIAMALKANPLHREFMTAQGPTKITEDGFVEPVKFALFRFDGTAFQKVKE